MELFYRWGVYAHFRVFGRISMAPLLSILDKYVCCTALTISIKHEIHFLFRFLKCEYEYFAMKSRIGFDDAAELSKPIRL